MEADSFLCPDQNDDCYRFMSDLIFRFPSNCSGKHFVSHALRECHRVRALVRSPASFLLAALIWRCVTGLRSTHRSLYVFKVFATSRRLTSRSPAPSSCSAKIIFLSGQTLRSRSHRPRPCSAPCSTFLPSRKAAIDPGGSRHIPTNPGAADWLVRPRRLELPRPFGHNDLNVARLPVPPWPHDHHGRKRASGR